MEKDNFEKIVVDFLGTSPLPNKVVPLSPGSWEYNQFDNKDPELIRVAISFQPRIVKPWQWYSYHPENDKKHRLGWGITLVEAYREANPD
jgi:hypothetical protein